MINIAIVEDNFEAEEKLKAFCERYSKEKGFSCSISWYENPALFLAKFNSDFDLIFLDIEMPEMNGIELARRIRKTDNNVVLVFVTNFSAFAVEGYEVDASDFIIKPVTYYDFVMKFEHALKRVTSVEDAKIVVKYNDVVKYISVADIYYVEVIKHKLVYHTSEGEFEVRGTLKKAEEELGRGFAKCNNYCLVNMRYVFGVDGYMLTVTTGIGAKNRAEILISHPRKKEFMQRLSLYLGDNI